MNFSKKIALVTLASFTTFSASLAPAWAAMSVDEASRWDSSLEEGRTLRDDKKYEAAAKRFLELQASAEKSDDKKRTRKAMTALAANYFYQKDYSKAEELDRKALGLAESISSVNDGTVAICLNDLAETLVEEKRFDEALPLIKRSVALSEEVFSHNHPLLGTRLNFLADLLERMGHKDDAVLYRSEGQGIINAFLSVMSRKIKAAWKPPRALYSYSANVGFEVTDHGLVKEVHIVDSSGNTANDEAAIEAVKNAQPFADINSKADDDQLNLSFKFDYNYHQGKESATSKNNKESDSANTASSSSGAAAETAAESKEKISQEKKKLDQILKTIEEIKKDKNHTNTTLAESYGQLSDTLMVLGEHGKAIDYLKEALDSSDFKDKSSPGTLMLLSELGCTYLNSMRPALAETTLKAVVDAPNFEQILDIKLKQQALDDLGHALSNMGRYAEAQRYYSRKRDSI
ncbi:TonB family protein [bacterium]|jgi:TonB family protein|nr:TonB family protein [bacterium]